VSSSAGPDPSFSTLVDLLRWRALRQPDRRAITFLADGAWEEAHLTYGELDRRARAIGGRIQAVGATGERVLLLARSGLGYIAAFFGCLYAGAVAVPAYPPRRNRSLDRLRAIVADGQITVALAQPEVFSAAEGLAGLGPGVRTLRWLTTDGDAPGGEAAWREPAVTPDTLAFLQYTSGSTALPKGVMLTHANLLHNSALIYRSFGHSPDSRAVIWLPPYHDMGLIGGILQPCYGGFPVTLLPPAAFLQCPFRWLQAISRTRATISGGPNFAYDLCTRKVSPEQKATLDLSSWRVAFTGAEPVRHETLEAFAAAFERCGFRRESFFPCYGLAEATLFVTGSQVGALPACRPVSRAALGQNRVAPAAPREKDARMLVGCGQAPPGQEVVIADPQSLTRCTPGHVGEIWVSGPSVARGYWDRPEETGRTFGAYLADTGEGPFLRTGDLGFLEGGQLFVTGRSKEVIVIRGSKHYPEDIELTAEKSHGSLRPGSCAAFSAETAGGERLVLMAELDHSLFRQHRQGAAAGDNGAAEVARAIRQAVAEHHELQVYRVLLLKPGGLPKTSSGKNQRHVCRAEFLSGNLETVEG
jgi:acyl-CoA synthetase (AMP-forming)/AMP-acid ligase II